MRFSRYTCVTNVPQTKLTFCDRHLSMPNGDGEIRTLDPLLARQVLSQLSYTPTAFAASGLKWTRTIDLTLIRRAL